MKNLVVFILWSLGFSLTALGGPKTEINCLGKQNGVGGLNLGIWDNADSIVPLVGQIAVTNGYDTANLICEGRIEHLVCVGLWMSGAFQTGHHDIAQIELFTKNGKTTGTGNISKFYGGRTIALDCEVNP